MQFIRIKNWEEHQHYKDRNPIWIKLYNSILDDYEFSCLQDASKLLLIHLWLLASKTGNSIPYDINYLQKKLQITFKESDIKALISNSFVECYQDASKTLATCLPREEKNREEKEERREEKENTTPTSQQVARSKEAIRTTQLLYDSIMANTNPTRYRNNPPKLEAWSKHIELLHTKDGIPYELIDKVILWATADDFWRANILSGSNLRKKFTTLEAKMKQPSRERKQPTASDIAEYMRLTEDKK